MLPSLAKVIDQVPDAAIDAARHRAELEQRIQESLLSGLHQFSEVIDSLMQVPDHLSVAAMDSLNLILLQATGVLESRSTGLEPAESS